MVKKKKCMKSFIEMYYSHPHWDVYDSLRRRGTGYYRRTMGLDVKHTDDRFSLEGHFLVGISWLSHRKPITHTSALLPHSTHRARLLEWRHRAGCPSTWEYALTNGRRVCAVVRMRSLWTCLPVICTWVVRCTDRDLVIGDFLYRLRVFQTLW